METGNKQKTNDITYLSPNIEIITLNINGLNIHLKSKDWQSRFKKKHGSSICHLHETHFKFKDICRLKVSIDFQKKNKQEYTNKTKKPIKLNGNF